MFLIRRSVLKSVLFQPNAIFMASTHGAHSWIADGVDGFLFDIYGVLYDSGSSDIVIPGSIEAVKK